MRTYAHLKRSPIHGLEAPSNRTYPGRRPEYGTPFGLDLSRLIYLKGAPKSLKCCVGFGTVNARSLKFTEQGEIVVEVRKEAESDNCTMFHFSVRDTGIGIPIAKQRLIFDAFSQADSSATRKFGGTGLGLAISNRLVNLMGGQIWVESEVGHGSTFHFTVQLQLG